ncbi:MAG: hypothetical protein ACJ789_04565 [Thermomicrobiales bacterium]
MRNLLGRLNARSAEELTRIAAAWLVPLTATDRHAQVGQLYRALSDPRTVRDFWELLDDDERALVRLLALDEDIVLTIGQLANRLGLTEEQTHAIAARLYRKGVVVREGDDEPLPVGVAPRLFLPRELSSLFRRVLDEIEVGDVSRTPLSALLALLDDAEIDEAARIWGLNVIPGIRGRDEMTRRLLDQVSDLSRVHAVAAQRRRDADLIWRRLLDDSTGAPVPLRDAAAAAGLSGRDPDHAHRLRVALAELEGALLAWHTYRPDGSRWLFVPAEIRTPRPTEAGEQLSLTPVLAELVTPPAWRHPHAVAWDLLTILRGISAPNAPEIYLRSELPRSWRRRLNRRCWINGPDVPPVGYVEFLLALAVAEGLLTGSDKPDSPVRATAAIHTWRDQSFGEQTARLRKRWMESTSWLEGAEREDVEVWGADWRGFRRRLLTKVDALDAGVWFPLDDVTSWLAASDADMLGPTFTAATARSTAAGDELTRRRAAIAEVAGVALTTSLEWFSIVEIATIPRRAKVVRRTNVPGVPSANAPLFQAAEAGPRSFELRPGSIVAVENPSPRQIWTLNAFAMPETLDRTSLYKLTPDTVSEALASGYDPEQIIAFLEAETRAPLDPAFRAEFTKWTSELCRIQFRRTLSLTTDETETLEAVNSRLVLAGFAVELAGNTLLVELPPGNSANAERAILQLLREANFAPQAAPPQFGRQREG